MIFTSTRNDKLEVSFSRAVKDCLPEDGGVFVPSANAFEDLRRWIYYINENTSFTSIAGTLTSAFMQNEFSPIICQTIAEKSALHYLTSKPLRGAVDELARLAVEGEADEPDRLARGAIRVGIALFADLRKGRIDRLADLELEDVNALLVLRHDVGAAV